MGDPTTAADRRKLDSRAPWAHGGQEPGSRGHTARSRRPERVRVVA